MSRAYIQDPREDIAWSLRAIRDALESIANTLDDYMEMSLTTGEMARKLAADPADAITRLEEMTAAIRKRREGRKE